MDLSHLPYGPSATHLSDNHSAALKLFLVAACVDAPLILAPGTAVVQYYQQLPHLPNQQVWCVCLSRSERSAPLITPFAALLNAGFGCAPSAVRLPVAHDGVCHAFPAHLQRLHHRRHAP
eukprot:scaffold214930_cov15-Tisochrysis_lutea.AAC.1